MILLEAGPFNFQGKMFWGLIYSVYLTRVEVPDVGYRPLPLQEQAPNYEIPPDSGLPSLRCDLLWDGISTFPTHFDVALLSFVGEALFSSLSGPFQREFFPR